MKGVIKQFNRSLLSISRFMKSDLDAKQEEKKRAEKAKELLQKLKDR